LGTELRTYALRAEDLQRAAAINAGRTIEDVLEMGRCPRGRGAHREASPCQEFAAPEDLGRSITRKQRSTGSRRERASASKVEWMSEKESGGAAGGYEKS
jgi:hypothetical protein